MDTKIIAKKLLDKLCFIYGHHKITKPAFQSLINNNIEWLSKQQDTLEARHIRQLLDDSVNMYYNQKRECPMNNAKHCGCKETQK